MARRERMGNGREVDKKRMGNKERQIQSRGERYEQERCEETSFVNV